ncbi:hypothetical protein SLEP1_g52362 [Rubroshorea leprosula]|uniref:Uncharacterized protein n=1 Tax=Rubroshorea leprosula TaxID=152421 RepID=A0AAV5M6X5_9ROSI|nr:hypothetical protein SLEP1_g52362 [Rubroshorea leprosula]
MATELLSPLVDVTISKVILVTTEQLNLAVRFKQDLRQFRVVLSMVRGVLQDAEQKKVTGHSDLQSWLKELGNIVDEADNVVDEIAYEHLRYTVVQKQMWKKVNYFFTLSNPLAFRLKIASRIKDLNLDLASLNDSATGLGLQHRLANMLPEHFEVQQTDSSIGDPSKIVGRENKVLEVIQSLIDSSNDQTLRIVSIVEMLQAFGENVFVDVTLDILVQKLEENLKEKNYLLILDDVWNEDKQKWESLSSCSLGIGKNVGSRVLVTTRSENVAFTMGTLSEHMHHLETLTMEDCWSIIKQRAFVSSSFPSELEGIGRDIASKCGGVALVANVIGGSLCNNRKKDNWLSIKDNSQVWGSMEEANGVFCKYCNFVMEKEMLIQLWMAEGFLQPFSERYLEVEDIDDMYFNALSSYSLFQDVERDSYGSIIASKMHDLVHDLAQSISKPQSLILEDGSGRNIPVDIRHLNVISNMDMTTTQLGEATKKLHTLFSQHLRFLDVLETRIKELPKFISKFYHLQTFRFMDCWEIKRPLKGIWDLVNLRHIYFNKWKLMPVGIGRLTSLKTLQLFVVGQQKGHRIEELRCLSQLRGKLEIRNLDMVKDKTDAMEARLSEKPTIQELQLVFGQESNGSANRCKHDEDILEGLQPHSNLKGLIIEYYCGERCPSWMSERVNFLKSLVFMTFCECPRLKSIVDSSLACDEVVRVEVGPFSMESLKKVHIKRCGKLENLPMISKLQSLEILEIWYCKQLRMIGDDAVFASTCLKELNISDCERLMFMPSVEGLSFLQKIYICRCGELKSIGESLSAATCLKEFTINRCNALTSLPSLHAHSSLQTLSIEDCYGLRSLPSLHGLSFLQTLLIRDCSGLISLPTLHGLSFLQTLSIRDCGGLRGLPSGLPSCTALEELAIANCQNLITIPDDLRSSWSIPNLACLTHLKKLTIGGFSIELQEFPELSFIGSSLEELTLFAWGKSGEHLLDQIQHLTALRYLKIRDFDGLEALPNWFRNLCSLQTLSISNCKSLKHMEAIRCLSKLEGPYIDECPELKERCARGSGSEWDYISHVQNIVIDASWIQHKGNLVEKLIKQKVKRGSNIEGRHHGLVAQPRPRASMLILRPLVFKLTYKQSVSKTLLSV